MPSSSPSSRLASFTAASSRRSAAISACRRPMPCDGAMWKGERDWLACRAEHAACAESMRSKFRPAY